MQAIDLVLQSSILSKQTLMGFREILDPTLQSGKMALGVSSFLSPERGRGYRSLTYQQFAM
jgi:hypothetical protein